MMGIDANLSMVLRSDNHDLVLGPFDVNHINDARRELHDLLSAKRLCSAATFFQKPAHCYASWHHPRSKKGHQLDHFLISRRDLSRVSDVGLSKLTVESDHEPLHLSLRIARILSKQHESKASHIDRGMLRDPVVARIFCTQF